MPNKKSKQSRPSDAHQKTRTLRNKKAQRARHSQRHPRDTKSLLNARRWT